MSDLVPLPLSGDLYRPNRYDTEGAIVPASDTIDATKLPEVAVRSKDVAAILMAELAEAEAKLAQKK